MNIVKMPVGPNDFGAPEDQVMEIVIPITLPEKTRYQVISTGVVFDSNGTILSLPEAADAF